MGYNKIPAYWKQGLSAIEDINFKYTTMSLNAAYKVGYKHAVENIMANGGQTKNEELVIRTQKPVPVRFEKSFDGIYPVGSENINWNDSKDEASFEFDGTGFVIKGDASEWASQSDYVFQTELYIDGKMDSRIPLPVSFTKRRYELAWKYDLKPGKHKVMLKILNPSSTNRFRIDNVLIYSTVPNNGLKSNESAEKSYRGNSN